MKLKITLLFSALIIGLQSQARVSDFNSLIDENSAAQAKLHKELKTSGKQTQTALRETDEFAPQVVVDDRSDSIAVPTKKNLLRFKKEIVDHRSRNKAAEKRVANEFKNNEF